MNKRIIVIGGGAAGMIAAISAAKNGNDVLLLEQNEKLGKKLYITGKGRCNITNANGREAFFNHVMRNPRFLYSAYHAFPSEAILELIENAGVPTKVERGGRAYPTSDKSNDVLRALSSHMSACGVKVQLHAKATSILVKDGKVEGVQTEKALLSADAVILCTGGLSYPSTGSTGDGYQFAEKLGHTITPPAPSLIPLETLEDWPFSLTGLSLKNVTLRAYEKEKLVYEELGEMLFTHFGVSGPLVLSSSAYIDHPEEARLSIDLKPGLTNEQLDKRLLRDLDAGKRMPVRNALSGLLPKNLLPVVLKIAEIMPDQPVSEFTKAERARLLRTLKGLPLTVKGTRPIEEAVITRGGVSTKEVDPKTMQSKLVSGLYFAGEILDTDALTGGYNLQIAWSTGALAGQSC
ncbi:NAD(P)/FAD-dependent oxidoreductase [Christensenellaceae bacterium OttesenSCG-928-M15]|nr:NAD(P)/FAD-dependent oxidoreductase [Christensenellaceae bacterium OttesenSCG-928-M15]